MERGSKNWDPISKQKETFYWIGWCCHEAISILRNENEIPNIFQFGLKAKWNICEKFHNISNLWNKAHGTAIIPIQYKWLAFWGRRYRYYVHNLHSTERDPGYGGIARKCTYISLVASEVSRRRAPSISEITQNIKLEI